MLEKQNIKDIGLESLPVVVKGMGLQPYVASQIIQWLYKKGARSFEEMTDLLKSARTALSAKFYISRLEQVKTLESVDGTKKFAWRLKDGNVIESVMIPAVPGEKVRAFGKKACLRVCGSVGLGYSSTQTLRPSDAQTRLTLCISTQVGCAMGCKFCRTAGMGHVRNLTQGEILDQILEIQSLVVSRQSLVTSVTNDQRPTTNGFSGQSASPELQRGERPTTAVTNVVLMGMGEPLANYENVVGAVKIMTNTKGLCLSKRHVTISTCGLVPAIERLAGEKLGVKLAVSLNATTDEARSEIMPINKKYPLAKLFKALKKYSETAECRRLTFEYVLMEGVNDSIEDAKRLVRFMSNIPSKVNLIPLNVVPAFRPGHLARPKGRDYNTTSEISIQRFAQYLRNKHIQVNIRQSRGADILAACGQLATK